MTVAWTTTGRRCKASAESRPSFGPVGIQLHSPVRLSKSARSLMVCRKASACLANFPPCFHIRYTHLTVKNRYSLGLFLQLSHVFIPPKSIAIIASGTEQRTHQHSVQQKFAYNIPTFTSLQHGVRSTILDSISAFPQRIKIACSSHPLKVTVPNLVAQAYQLAPFVDMQQEAIISMIVGIIAVLVACIGIYVTWKVAKGKPTCCISQINIT